MTACIAGEHVTQWFSKLFARDASKNKPASGWERKPSSGAKGPPGEGAGGRRGWPARDEAAPRDRGASSSPSPSWGEDPHEAPTRLVKPDEPEAGSTPAKPERSEAAPTSTDTDASPRRLEEPADMTRLVAPAEHEDNDPVAGWLVVVKGPGLGRSVEIGAGANPIGRASSQKIRLDFGDTRISRERHAVVVYEPKARRFFLQGGEVRNLTYVGDTVVLTPVELTGGELITIGETQMKFVPFCGPQFGWPE